MRHKKIRACMVAYTFYETDNRVRRYAETLARRGDHVDVIALRREGQPKFEFLKGVHVHRIQGRVRNERGPVSYLLKLGIFFFWSALVLTLRHLRTPYALIHVHSVPDFEVFAAVIPHLLGAKVILDIHDIVPEFYASKFNVSEKSIVFSSLLLMERLSARFAHHVIIANHLWYKKLIERSVTADHCTAIINYPDTSIFYLRDRMRTTHEFLLCYPGTLNWHQGLDIAVSAFAVARQKQPAIRFLIVGDGPDREKLKRMIEEQNLGDCVTLAGSVTLEKVAELMAEVDLGIVPKRKDSFGNEAFSTKILEFMAAGVPVLASDTRIDRYYFNDRVLRFFPSGSVQDLAAGIVELASHPNQCASLRMNGLRFVEETNWNAKKQEYTDIVDRLCPQP